MSFYVPHVKAVVYTLSKKKDLWHGTDPPLRLAAAAAAATASSSCDPIAHMKLSVLTDQGSASATSAA